MTGGKQLTITFYPRGLFITAAVFLVIGYASSAAVQGGGATLGTCVVLGSVALELLMWHAHAATRE